MFYYRVVNKAKFEFDDIVVKNIFKVISKRVAKKQSWNINIVFLTPKEVQELNKNYRKIDKTTDVLSFHYFHNFENFKKNDTIWEIILNEEKIFSQSKEYKISIEKEFYNLVIHSVLHILWFDHEEEEDYEVMYKLESEIWEDIFKEKKI